MTGGGFAAALLAGGAAALLADGGVFVWGGGGGAPIEAGGIACTSPTGSGIFWLDDAMATALATHEQ